MLPVAFSFSDSHELIKAFIRQNVFGHKNMTANKIKLMEAFLSFFQRNPQIKIEDEVFIPAKDMQKILREYQPFRDACFKMKGFHSKANSKCDRIVGYTDEFLGLVTNILKVRYLEQKKRRSKLYNTQSVVSLGLTKESSNTNMMPGAAVENYRASENSARHYIWLQNLTRDMKKEIYAGLSDLDIVGCFPNIFFREVLKGECNNFYMNLMIVYPEHFLNMLITDNVAQKLYPHRRLPQDRDSAKIARSRLFHPPTSGRKPKASGIGWYDDLQHYIINNLNACGITDAHMFFTTIEQRIITQAIPVVGANNVILRMHDGFIVNVQDTEEVISQLQSITGYAWSHKTL
jgi:hypothetical protein